MVHIWMIYPLVNLQIVLENCPSIVDLPMKIAIFHSYVINYQRLSPLNWMKIEIFRYL